MAAIQALINQETNTTWGNPNPIYYQIAQNEYGVAGGSFQGTGCNSSGAGGPASGCAFNDVTQGDIDLACEDNGTLEEAHCYKPSGTYGVDSTDAVTAGAVFWGGSGYTYRAYLHHRRADQRLALQGADWGHPLGGRYAGYLHGSDHGRLNHRQMDGCDL